MLNESLSSCNWNQICNSDNINEVYDMFVNTYTNLLNAYCPIVKVKLKCIVQQTWLAKGLVNVGKKKNHLYKTCIRYKTKGDERKYKQNQTKLVTISMSTNQI